MRPLLTETHVVMYTRECVDIFHPETGVKTINDYVRRVDQLSLNYIEDHNEVDEEDENYKDKANAFKGDMLEVLSEIFFGVYFADPKVGVRDYAPVPLTEDYGVDFIGTNVVGNKVAGQCKFRNNPSAAITYGDMAKTYTAGQDRHHLSLKEPDTLILFTTANNISKACKQVLGSKIRLIDRNIISIRIDNNETFWKEAEQRIVATINKLNGR